MNSVFLEYPVDHVSERDRVLGLGEVALDDLLSPVLVDVGVAVIDSGQELEDGEVAVELGVALEGKAPVLQGHHLEGSLLAAGQAREPLRQTLHLKPMGLGNGEVSAVGETQESLF